MTSTIYQLKNSLDGCTDSDEKLRLKGLITELKNRAEASIRHHKRDVDFETKEYTVELAVKKYSEGLYENNNELFVPDYQRDFVWDEKKKSRLIESLLMGLPIPYIFTADIGPEDPEYDGRVEIVDGSQRVRTLHAFLKDEFELSDLKILSDLNGFKFSDLPASRQRRFNRIPLRVIELSESCTEETRRDLFERINTGSDELKDMEVRKGSKHGDSRLFRDLIVPCSKNEVFVELAPMTKAKLKRGERGEFALRFFSYLNNYQGFSHSVREFLDDYLENNCNADEGEISSMKAEFDKAMLFIRDNVSQGFRKTPNAKSTSRVRFEAMAVGAALALRENPSLEATNVEWLDSDEFISFTTSDASNSRPRVIARIEYARDKFLEG